MKLIRFFRTLALVAACGFVAPVAFAQSVLNKTDLGKSQNTPDDLANSLIVNNKPKIGKGEKKEQVDPSKLPSKTIKDPMFQGSLNDIGLDWTSDKIGKSHDPGADSKSAKQSAAASEKNSKGSSASESTGARESKASKSSNADGDASTQQKAAAASHSDEKSSDKEKTAKTDGDR